MAMPTQEAPPSRYGYESRLLRSSAAFHRDFLCCCDATPSPAGFGRHKDLLHNCGRKERLARRGLGGRSSTREPP